jgi:hypothetical protein
VYELVIYMYHLVHVNPKRLLGSGELDPSYFADDEHVSSGADET